jgi:hypothetical protein
MPSHPRNMPEQEHSIKARSHELFVEETPALSNGATKPFAAYLRETPARPLSPVFKVLFWFLGIIVALLFLLAVWRVAHRHHRLPARKPAAETVMVRDPRHRPPPGHDRQGPASDSSSSLTAR